jgi:hypothetical protein
MKILTTSAALAVLLASTSFVEAKKSHYLKQAGGQRPARVKAYDGTECIKDDAELYQWCVSHAVDWEVGFEWNQESSTEYFSATTTFLDYFKIAFSIYSEQEINIMPYV